MYWGVIQESEKLVGKFFNILRMLKALWAYRGFVWASVKREFQARYKNSMLGAAWTVINPLAMITVYTVIFSQILRAKLPGVESSFSYSIYLCAGILTWGLFAEILGRATNIFLEQANFIKKINFPRICLPAIVVCSAGLNFAIIFGLFLGFLLVTGNFPGWSFLGFFPVLVVQIVFTIGLGTLMGILNVFFRDVGQFILIALQFWFWLTPIVYPVSIVPDYALELLNLNPMARVIEAYHTIFVYGQWPDWSALWPVGLVGLFLSWVALLTFYKRSAEMMDEL